MNVMPMPDGVRAKVHYHKTIETIADMLSGNCTVRYGDAMEQSLEVRAGDQIFFSGNMPDAPCNDSGATCTWLVLHASGSDY